MLALNSRSPLLPALLLSLSASLLCACGSTVGESPAPELRLVTAVESDWQAAQLEARLSPAGDGWELSIVSHAAQPARSLLLEAYLPEQISAQAVQALTPDAELSLLVAEHPGVVALGVIMPAGASIQPGEVLRAHLYRDPGQRGRSVSRIPGETSCKVGNLAGIEDGLGGFTLNWSYYNSGDYNQDGRVSIADLAQIGIHFGEQSDSFPAPFPAGSIGEVVDGNGDGQVAISDLTPIGINFLNQIDNYRVFRCDEDNPLSPSRTQIGETAAAPGQAPTDSRRVLSYPLPLADIAAGAWYFVEPFETASSSSGASSNTVQFTDDANVKFRVPPAGEQVVDAAQGQNPSLVSLPAQPGLSQAGAPVIVYTTLGGGGTLSPLLLAYYDGSAWVTQDVGGGGNFADPAALWIPADGDTPGHGVVVAYSQDSQKVVELDFDEQWQPTGSRDIDNGGGVFLSLDLDRDPLSGALGVAHCYTGLGTGTVDYSFTDENGDWVSEGVFDGDTVSGLTFRFDPAGGEPWLLFTHGTLETTPTISLAFALEQSRRGAGGWTTTPVPYPDSPLALDLGFRADGTPQLAATAARDITVPIPGNPFTASLLFDVVTAEYSGGSWQLAQSFESSLGISFDGFPPTAVILNLDLASDIAWAAPDELMRSTNTGSITLDITNFIPQDGSFDSASQYMLRQSAGIYTDSSFYKGSAGRSFSWQPGPGDEPACACVRATSLSVTDLLSGNFAAAGELAYWRP